ncbi:MAG: DUF1553 domain-containing protein [Saprospiraceae bacterium]|nr:DUF1553 domain-containing protein [Saprospiraceae bacterium]
MRLFFLFAFLIGLISCRQSLPSEVSSAYESLPDQINYNFDVKPILSDRCYSCHGPDDEARQADLRLDVPESALAKLESGSIAIKPGSWWNSSLAQRILSDDSEMQMPPPDSRLRLEPSEKAMLLKWIEQGATYEPHWSFIKPTAPIVPEADDHEVYNPIDAFVVNRMIKEGLAPSPPASKERLLRRAYLDLTGLPPSIDQIEEFLTDHRHDAFEKVVDRLLVSDACAERLTLEWMDIARYADSHGLHADGWRNMWPWRDWVLRAFQQNMPYDQFITLQLAGDLLLDAGKDEILATAFHRNHPMTAEGGAIDEEFRLEYVADRTNTTATALMGMTIECAKCHDHKFDPISQKDYYAMSAFFNNQRELGMTGDDGNYGPMLSLESPSTRQKLASLDREIFQINEEINKTSQEVRQTTEAIQNLGRQGNINSRMEAFFPFDHIGQKMVSGKLTTVIDANTNCTSFGKPDLVEGKVSQAISFTDEYHALAIENAGKIEANQALSVGLWIKTKKKKEGKTQVLVGNAGNKNQYWRGWDFYLDDQNKLGLRLVHSLPHNMVHLLCLDSIQMHTWTHVAFSYDGSGEAQGCRLYLNGKQAEVDVLYNQLTRSILPVRSGDNEVENRPLQVGKSYRSFTGDNGIFQGLMDELRIYAREVSPFEVALMAGLEQENLAPDIFASHLTVHSPKIKALKLARSRLIGRSTAIRDTVPEIMVMREMPSPRPTFILDRGQYDAPLETVSPATPPEILPFPDEYPNNRLGLAKWLFHPDHPLTARATANRYWQMIFGKGIVKTANDFGNQGSLPSHPELLDWLATRLIDTGWDIRDLLKTMVMSAIYQQSSVATAPQREIDPENIYLARAPTYRLPAELIRDNALAASGLLVRKVGGPSVKPYQPEGLWIEKGTFSHKLLRYVEDEGDDLYRRSLYTFIKRTSPHPAMTVFDVPSRDVCTLTRETTNTPLQALVLLNDPQFVEAARVLAERVLLEETNSIKDKINLAFRLVITRTATTKELELMASSYDDQLVHFQEKPAAARDLLSVGDYRRQANLSMIETAAMTLVTSNILNHDEAYMKR